MRTLNVGFLTRKTRDLANTMERKKIDILCSRDQIKREQGLFIGSMAHGMVWMVGGMEYGRS